jgi:meso-butanediol dehydrogenase/(S,S)-butanediol dehydrogenase/diacetyl reductase
MSLLKDRVIFLTGAANGIGRECALAYAREGAVVVVADIDVEGARQLAEEIGGDVLALRCDAGEASSVESAITETVRRLGRIDAIHNNAGIVGPARPLHESTEADWDEVQRVNLKSVYLTARYGFEAIRVARGAILNTASAVGLIGQDNHAAYVASKGAMISLTKAMALDYASFGVRVNAICPAAVWTPMLRNWAAGLPDPAGIARVLDQIHPIGYCPEGDVIADAAVFLLSDKARFITGCILPVTGGAELGYKRATDTIARQD